MKWLSLSKRAPRFGMALLIAMVVAVVACAPAPPAAEAPPATIALPTAEMEAAEPAGEPQAGGTLIMAMWQQPVSLNHYYTTRTRKEVRLCCEGLIGLNQDGEYVPVLAQEVPTVQNGGVSDDFKTITYHLKPGVKWQDGEPLTSADVKFTYEIVTNPVNAVAGTRGFEKVESVETPDDLTVIVHLNEVYGAYPTLFPVILPKHKLEDLPDLNMNQADFNEVPLGTGPFMVTEWVRDDHLTLVRNPYYREPGKPLLDEITFQSIPSPEAAIALLKSGDIDGVWGLLEAHIPDLQSDPNIDLWIAPSQTIERLFLNLSKPQDPNDPDVPHPVLGDPKVREAIELAIDKQVIVDTFLHGLTDVATSEPSAGWAHNPNLKPSEFDPERARELLDEAGWTVNPDTGIREKDGVRAELEIQTTSGNKVREQVEVLIKEWLADVGIELTINNVPANVLFGNWADGAARHRGTFDILMYAAGPGLTESAADPQSFLYNYYHSSRIPSEENGGVGWNYTRIQDDIIDNALDEAGSTVDFEKRKAAYYTFAERAQELRSHVYLYDRLQISALRDRVKGWEVNAFDTLTWDAQNWWLEQ